MLQPNCTLSVTNVNVNRKLKAAGSRLPVSTAVSAFRFSKNNFYSIRSDLRRKSIRIDSFDSIWKIGLHSSVLTVIVLERRPYCIVINSEIMISSLTVAMTTCTARCTATPVSYGKFNPLQAAFLTNYEIIPRAWCMHRRYTVQRVKIGKFHQR